ncbi:MAG TPA: TIGR02266 family protein [Anaeromyxobacteraceae bacterium]|nr:TIGR02266 family protein [Anaeromyxobacteraceae bacterium]
MTEDKRQEPRAPVELALRLAYGSIEEFILRYAVNISRGGMFVRTRDPRPAGTPVRFDLQLKGGEHVICGEGVVVWSTSPSAPGEPTRVPGMGVRFTALDPGSRALVDRMVAGRGTAAQSDEPPRPPIQGGSAEAVPQGKGPPAPATTPARKRSRRIIGIDLGTTNSCAAVAEGGKVRLLATREGYSTLPSVVAYDAQGRLLVGHPAKAQMVVNPKNTVYGSKRLLGRPFASPTVQACRDRFHYEIVEGSRGTAAVLFAGRVFTLQQVAAYVLAELRELASKALGEEVSRAVVTVPAYYNDHQRQAVREAGLLAGLHVERIVNEPTAAAVAFGFGRGYEKRVLVYDLGGGTFDASVLEIQGDVYEVVSTGGDTFLGGVDFDNQLVDHLAFSFMRQHGFPPPADRVVWQRIRDAAEETKVALSSRTSAVAEVPYLCKDRQGRDVHLRIMVTRAELEELTARLVERTLLVCEETLAAKGLTKDDLQEVLLVGGQSRMPLVWKSIRERLGREPSKAVHPDEAVALGAALLADSESRIDAVVLIDVLAIGIGVGMPGGRLATVLARNTRLPAKRSYELSTRADGQTEMELTVFQGDAALVTECEYLGTLRLSGLPAARRGEVKVEVEFSLGNEGILSISAKNLATSKVTAAEFATVDTPESLRAKLGLSELPTAPRGARPIEPSSRAGRPSRAAERDGAAVPGASTDALEKGSASGESPGKRGLFGRLFGR